MSVARLTVVARAIELPVATIEEADRLWFTEYPQPKDGRWSPYPDRSGLGLQLDPIALKRYAV